jgi:hypothetical protein
MTGPEHYRHAEELAEEAGAVMDAEWGIYSSMGVSERLQRRSAFLAHAQVHATLALAAATALNQGRPGMTDPDWNAWVDAASAYERLDEEATA